MELKIRSNSPDETISIGERFGKMLEKGDVIGLCGELGSGKTYFTKGIAISLGIPPDIVVSPSFTLVNEYEGTVKLYHMDAYRLERDEFLSAGLDEYFYKDGIAVMEWADRWPDLLPENTILVRFYIVDEEKRDIIFSAKNERGMSIIKKMREKLWHL